MVKTDKCLGVSRIWGTLAPGLPPHSTPMDDDDDDDDDNSVDDDGNNHNYHGHYFRSIIFVFTIVSTIVAVVAVVVRHIEWHTENIVKPINSSSSASTPQLP